MCVCICFWKNLSIYTAHYGKWLSGDNADTNLYEAYHFVQSFSSYMFIYDGDDD